MIIAAMVGWEAWSLAANPHNYPSFSSVVDLLWHFHGTSILLFELWLLLGWDILVSRRHRLKWFDNRTSLSMHLLVIGGSLAFAALATLLPPRNGGRWAAIGIPFVVFAVVGMFKRPSPERPLREWMRRSRTWLRSSRLSRRRGKLLGRFDVECSPESEEQ